jgi:hypothetical protein
MSALFDDLIVAGKDAWNGQNQNMLGDLAATGIDSVSAVSGDAAKILPEGKQARSFINGEVADIQKQAGVEQPTQGNLGNKIGTVAGGLLGSVGGPMGAVAGMDAGSRVGGFISNLF